MLKNILLLGHYQSSIAPDDLIAKQRYKLFKTTSFVGTLACFVFVLQNLAVYSLSHPIVFLTTIIGTLFLFNLFLLNFHKNPKVAYVVIGITSNMIIHLNMYDAGGIRASAAFYFAPITLMIFMLLGNKIGRMMFLLVIANLVYFYVITTSTNWVSYELIGNTPNQINFDILITGLFASVILGTQINYLESGKNVVIQRITEQRNELRVKNIELKKLSMVASKADNAILITDSNGVAEWVNDGFVRLTGYSYEEVVGRKPNEFLVHKLTSQEVQNELREAMENGRSFNGEMLKYKKDGKKFWTQITMTPITSEENNLQQFIFIESDITPRKIVEEKMNQYLHNLEKTNRELDKFAYVVSHDLKAPLRAIGNLTGWIEEDMGDRIPDEIRGHFNTIKGRVFRMEGLINGILDYTKAAKSEGNLESVMSDALVRDAIDLIGVPANAIINIRNNMPELKTEKVRIQQIFMNLIGNAIRYNDKEDIQIEIGCEDAGTNWKFYVKDNGPGIEKRYHEKIFVIFQTLNARDEVESRGVGLAIVKKIIEEEGGFIWVESDKNQGTTFCFTWPKEKKKAIEESFMTEDALV
jgi:PAS domain S-box-containing protein